MEWLKEKPVWLKWLIGIATEFLGPLIIRFFFGDLGFGGFLTVIFVLTWPFLYYRLARAKKFNTGEKEVWITCPNCKYEGEGVYRTKGSFIVEVLLWLCLLVPGMIYTAWRLTTRAWACPRCDYDKVAKFPEGRPDPAGTT